MPKLRQKNDGDWIIRVYRGEVKYTNKALFGTWQVHASGWDVLKRHRLFYDEAEIPRALFEQMVKDRHVWSETTGISDVEFATAKTPTLPKSRPPQPSSSPPRARSKPPVPSPPRARPKTPAPPAPVARPRQSAPAPPESQRGPLYGSLRWIHPGCLMWILITFVCISTIWIGPLFSGQGNDAGIIGVVIVLAAGVGILWLIMTITEYLTGESSSSGGTGDPASLDRGAGTMSWYDSDDGGGSE